MKILALAVALAACGSDGSNNNNSCSFLGTWSGTLQGETEVVTYTSDGKFVVTVNGGAGPAGMWTQSGNSFTITDPSCGTTVGTYTATFSADCKTVTVAVVSDTCPGRSSGVMGVVFTKQ